MSKIARGLLATLLIAGSANVAMAQGASKLHTVKNSVKYKDTGAKPATGRSGSATLEARVLIAKDSSMFLEASTGSLDAATHPGTIAKMQVKIGNDFIRNYNGLDAGGYWSATLPAATPGTSIQLQGSIRDIDPKRTGVVTVMVSPMLRPDVSVLSVSGPQTQAPNTPVIFNAHIVELNGDVGARTKCVLSVDGTAVDSADNIWVDAGGSVSCQFTHSFATAGTYAVSVAATNVNPSDWDTANNSASTSITIVNPNDTMIAPGSMGAWQDTYEFMTDWRRSGGLYCSYGYTYYCSYSSMGSSARKYSSVSLTGYSQGGSPGGAQKFNVKLLTNGALSDSASLTPTYVSTYSDGSYYSNCTQYTPAAVWNGSHYIHNAYWIQMCSAGNLDYPNRQSTYYLQRISGHVIYYGAESYCYAWGNCDSYSWTNNAETYGNGQDLGWTAGTQVRLQLSFVDSNGDTHSADRSVTLHADQDFLNQEGPGSGWNEWEGNWYYHYYHRVFRASGWTDWSD